MLLSYNELVKLVENGVINAPIENINPCSIDVRLGSEIIIENPIGNVIDLKARDVFLSTRYEIDDNGYALMPGEFILAHTIEVFNLPNNIAAEFKLKSSGARIGLENALATWCDPGWNGSTLTLELKNLLRYQSILLRPGDKIGQMIFTRVEPVPEDRSYAVVGRYNNDKSVQTVKL